MNVEALDGIFIAACCAVAIGVAASAWRSASASTGRAGKTAAWIQVGGFAACVAYTLARAAAVAAAMKDAGLDPSAFLAIDFLSVVPYVLSAPRAARAAAEGRLLAFAGWAVAFLFGALAPAIYLAIAFEQTGGTAASLAMAYAALMCAIAVFGLLRKAEGRRGTTGVH